MLTDDRRIALALKAYKLVAVSGLWLQPVLLLLFRLHWGWKFVLTGQGKLVNHAGVVEFFASLGIPFPALNAWFVGGLECMGGVLLVLGLFSRPIGMLLSVNMLVAYLSVVEDRAKLFNLFVEPSGFITAEPFFFLLTSALVWAFGPGLISLDQLLKRVLCRKIGECGCK